MKCILLGMLASAGVFLLSVWPRYFNRYFGVDTWRILKIADYLRNNKKYPTYLSEQYIVQGKFDHPIMLSAFLALFSKKVVDKYQFLVSPIIESLHCFTLFLYVYLLTNNITTALIAQLFYTLTPMVLMESSQLSTRSVGSFIFTLTWIALMQFSFYGGWLYFFIAEFMVVFLTLTHRMSMQVLVLLSIFFLAITASYWYFLLSVLGIGISWFCFGNKYKSILKGHIKLLRLWYMHIDKRYAHQIRGVPGKNEKIKQTDFVRRIERMFVNIPGFSLLAPNIWMIIVFLVLLLPEYKTVFVGLFSHIWIWAASLFALALATSLIKRLRFMGSGERYIEYSAFPVAMVAAIGLSAFSSNPPFDLSRNLIIVLIGVVAVLGALLPALVMQINVILKDKNRSITPELRKIIDYLKAEEDKSEIRLACIPHQLADGVLYFTNRVKLYLTDSNEHIEEMFKKWWPLIKQPIAKTLEERQITHLLINENYISLEEITLSYIMLKREGPFVVLFLKKDSQ